MTEFRTVRDDVFVPQIRRTDKSGNVRYRTEKTDKSGHIVNAKIHTDSRTGKTANGEVAEQHVIVAVDNSCKTGDVANHSLVDCASCRLQRGSKKCIRSTAQTEPFPVCQSAQFNSRIKIIRHCFFGIYMLPSFQSFPDDFFMCTHWSQIHNHLDFGIRQHLIDRAACKPIFCSLLNCFIHPTGTHRFDTEIIKPLGHVFEIDVADDSSTDDTDTYLIFHNKLPSKLIFGLR